MKYVFKRLAKVRDYEECDHLDENSQARHLVSKCFGLDIDVVRDMDMPDFNECLRIYAENHGLKLED